MNSITSACLGHSGEITQISATYTAKNYYPVAMLSRAGLNNVVLPT